MTSPWLQIPAPDYEAHMQAAGQSAVLRDFFARAYAEVRPRRLAILGCSTGADFARIDPAITDVIVGVDLNEAYLDVARARSASAGIASVLLPGDVLQVELPSAPFDLVSAALLLEYVDPERLFGRIAGWLAEGGVCQVVSQQPSPELPAVTATGYRSLEALSGCLTLRTAAQVEEFAARTGLRLVAREGLTLASGKTLVRSVFGGVRQ